MPKKKGIKNVILITSGFDETGSAGKALETRMVEYHRYRSRREA